MHIYINKVFDKSHIHIWPKRFRGFQIYIYIYILITIHIQELGFKGLGNPGYGFSSQIVGRALQFHTLSFLSFSL
jgi:hypothetical protein